MGVQQRLYTSVLSSSLQIWCLDAFFRVVFIVIISEFRSQVPLSPLSSGTTWMQEMVTLITSRGDPHLCQTVPNWTRAPWLEQHYFTTLLEASSTAPRVITTHLHHHLLVPALQGSKAKVHIYIFCAGCIQSSF